MVRFDTEGRRNRKSSTFCLVVICLFIPYFSPGFHFAEGALDSESLGGSSSYTFPSAGTCGVLGNYLRAQMWTCPGAYFRNQNASSLSTPHALWRAPVQGLCWKIKPGPWEWNISQSSFVQISLSLGSGGQWRDEKEKKKKEWGEPGKNTLGHRIYGQKRTKLGVQWFIRATLPLPVPRLPPTPLTSNPSLLF